MKILLCNKFYFLNGGTEKYLRNMMEELSVRGHSPIPFSVGYGGNWESPYQNYFLPPPGRADQVRYESIRLSWTNWIRYLDRAIYSFEAQAYLSKLLDAVGGADVAYLLNIYNYMSPSIIHTFRRRKIPVVLRLGDYNLLCPAYLFLREGLPCTLCDRGKYCHGFRYRCVKGSYLASALRVFAMYVHRWIKIYSGVDAFVVPSRFMKERMIAGGFPPDKIHLLKTPVTAINRPVAAPSGNYILFFGRISREKGLDLLLRAFQAVSTEVDLVLAGRSYDGEEERLRDLILPQFKRRIRFLGFLDGQALARQIAGALFTVVPSRWFDNAPNSVYESLQHGVPVLGANIGGIAEQIIDGSNGRLFEANSEESLRRGLQWMLADRERLRRLGTFGREWVGKEHGIETHVGQLISLFESLRR
jgi:glycosyltransferase involved in cell wall biosynthesis